MRARHQLNSVPPARVYGSPSISQPPMHASNSPNGRSLVDLPRRGDSYGHVSIAESLALSHGTPASSTITSAPVWVSAWAAMPPPAPEPTMHTSYCLACRTTVLREAVRRVHLRDRKSTRLNSSNVPTSYAFFFLNNKNVEEP